MIVFTEKVMKDYSQVGIIIQVRYSSTRLPGKMLMPFHEGKTMIEVFLENIMQNRSNQLDIVLATSVNSNDDVFEEVAQNFRINIYRGDENDVLQRMVDAARKFNFTNIIRVCADNPVYDIKGTVELIDYHLKTGSDYTAYCLEGMLPSIRTHLGLWGEIVKIEALERVIAMTNEAIYHEHVTNYLYENPDVFKVNLVEAPSVIFNRRDIRLTVDELDDFKLMQEIYGTIKENSVNFTIDNLIKLIDSKPEYLQRMKKQIQRNQK